MFLWGYFKLPVTPSTHSLENNILNQMSYIECGISDKTKDHIERSYQLGKPLEKISQCVTNFT